MAAKQFDKYIVMFGNDDALGLIKDKSGKAIKNADNQDHWWYDTSEVNFWKQECVIFDMWMLTKSKFFIGTWHSTLTRTVCHWRGWDRMYQGSHCFLQHKWNRENDKFTDWFDVKKLKQPQLTWDRKEQ